jgi:hypothetical protein
MGPVARCSTILVHQAVILLFMMMAFSMLASLLLTAVVPLLDMLAARSSMLSKCGY